MRNFDTRKRILVTGGAGFLGSHLCDRLLGQGNEVLCVDNLFTGNKRNIDHLHDHARFEFIRHDVTFPLYVAGRRDLQPRLSGVADPLPARPGPDDQDIGARGHQHAGPREAPAGANPPGVDQRGLRRPAGPSADGKLLGPRQPDRHPLVLRRGQALRRNPVLRLPSTARARDQGGADLQHLRSADAPQRWACRVELHRAGAAERTDHDLRRRQRRRARSATWTTWSRHSWR